MLAVLVLLNLGLLTLALFLGQEGRAQQATPNIDFFVDFPTELLPLVYLALVLIVLNITITFFVISRNLYRRRWLWITTAIAAVCLLAIVWQLGLNDTWTVINPSNGHLDLRLPQ